MSDNRVEGTDNKGNRITGNATGYDSKGNATHMTSDKDSSGGGGNYTKNEKTDRWDPDN